MTLYSGEQTLPVSVKGLTRSDTGEYVDDAVIEFTIYNGAFEGNPNSGYSWPLILDYDGNGDYSGAINTDLEEGCTYTGVIKITSGVNVETYKRRAIAQSRPW